MSEILPEGSILYIVGFLIVAAIGFLIKNIATANLKPLIEKYGMVNDYMKKLGTKKRYFKNLYEELSKMPFVLHDFELDIEGNYVEVRDNKIDIETLKTEERRNVYQEYEMKPFVIILGNAGIGKTYFFKATPI